MEYELKLTENEAKEIIGRRWLEKHRKYFWIQGASLVAMLIVAMLLGKYELNIYYSLIILLPLLFAFVKSRNGCRKYIKDTLDIIEEA